MPNLNNLSGRQKLAGTVGAGAAALLIATVAQWEGKRNDPYQDIIGKWTVCYGETNVTMRRYTDAECEDMLANSLVTYAKPVLARNPELRDHPNQLAAAVSLSYNIGNGNYYNSTVAKRFAAGNYRGACEGFLNWNRATFGKPQAGGQCYQKKNGRWSCVVRGLDRRRRDERSICLTGLPS